MLPKILSRLSFIVLLAISSQAQVSPPKLTVTPHVDQRVELLSIIFRLAGNFEYNMSQLTSYTGDIDTYFFPYKNHPAVTMAKTLAEKNGVSFDAVMSMAIHLSDPPALAPVVPFADHVPEARWGKHNAIKFAQLAADFYRDTHFDKFYPAHGALYEMAESRFQKVLGGFDADWYRTFYGDIPKGQFHLILAVNNGGANYGPRVNFPDGREEIFAIIGCAKKDEQSNPIFDASDLAIIVHEFNHSFVNPAVDEHVTDFAPAEKIFQRVAAKMQAQAYGSTQTMVNESLVRAAVILYFESHGAGPRQTQARVIREQANGFTWIDDLCALLRQYESQRDRYPTFAKFVPAVADFYGKLPDHIEEKLAGFHEKCVHVVSMQPFANFAKGVDPALQELIVTFSRPLDPGRHSINFGPQGKEHYPLVGDPEFLQGSQSIRLHLQLKPTSTYAFVLTSADFAAPDGYPLEDYFVTFNTK